MPKLLDTILLTALPASGKSEVRRYLALQDAETVARDFHMGPSVQLDDYPYVHMMRRISEELASRGHDPTFFASSDQPFKEPLDWGTLIELVNEDFDDLRARPRLVPKSASSWLFDRFDSARKKVGAEPLLAKLPSAVRAGLAAGLEEEAHELLHEKIAGIPDSLAGKTVVIEFARGGPQGSSMPLDPPYGYAYSFSRLSDAILSRACVLYIWVTPEESRRKNEERAKPGREGDASILHHGVPIAVMLGDYGTDDVAHLIGTSNKPGTVRVEARGKTYHLPIARFDNRRDLTTFIREDPEAWPPQKVAAVHGELARALGDLAGR